MWPFSNQRAEKKMRSVFLDASAYEKCKEQLAINTSARFARGGAALQMRHVQTEKQFKEEQDALRRKVLNNDYNF